MRRSAIVVSVLALCQSAIDGFSPCSLCLLHVKASGRQREISKAMVNVNSVIRRKQTRNTLCSVRYVQPSSNQQSDDKSAFITSDPKRALKFSALMIFCGAVLGPFLDSYHSAFGVLQYGQPIKLALWGTDQTPALTTAWWVPELFGVAGFLIGWLYIVLDKIFQSPPNRRAPSAPAILLGISFFTFQYWLSGFLAASGVDRATILNTMSILAAGGFILLDNTFAGLVTSLATALGGPLIEVGLLSTLSAYHYTDSGETGYFPLWIAPVYFLGGPAVGNLGRGFWNVLGNINSSSSKAVTSQHSCKVCGDTRCVPCPNCDGQGYYFTYNRRVDCNSCRGRGFVICRACFSNYDEDPSDLEAIRDLMARMPD